MSDDILRVKSISQLHEMVGFDKPKHPLITVLDVKDLEDRQKSVGVRMSSDLYMIAQKHSNCGLLYGRNHYDFSEGVLVFVAPHQVIAATQESIDKDEDGWMLFFHPDLVRKSSLGEKIDDYTFFSYDAHEALHLSDDEQNIMTGCVNAIRGEYQQRIDNHSQNVMVAQLELMLNYCSRFYERQFNTRTAQNKDIVTQVELLLKDYFNSGQLTEFGVPTIQYFANKVHLSANYLSDLLKKETGRSTKDHINDFLVDKAKNLLLNSSDSVSEIAYDLGFNYPHYFSRLFKSKTGMTPQHYRELN